jgi:hypothetical protein
MLRIDKSNKTLIGLERKTMRESGYWERRDVQEMICRAPSVFCEELGYQERFHLVDSEIRPTDFVEDRIDLLAVDPDGGVVIIELKRDSDKLQLLQALSYAGMVDKWEPKRFLEELFNFSGGKQQNLEQAKEELEEFLDEGEVENINRKQRIILLAEAFDYEVLVTAEWLTERYDLDIRCYRLQLAKHGNDDFLVCTRAYPPPELTEFAIRRRRKKEVGPVETPEDWPAALKSVENEAVANFFRDEVKGGRSNNPAHKALRFRIGNRRRFVVSAKRKFARVYQSGRFDDDIEFWKSRLGKKADVIPIGGGSELRFYLFDDSDFTKFKRAVTMELSSKEFHGGADEKGDEVGPDSEEADQAAE